ncbi:MAG TPA: PQQ-dependent sugar dehydrogenase [Verrucomicrobiota bacterium]|nr:PQQ-dependent sugar dehydrogenase [Verrucomicrobiota bacterium]
MKSPIRTLVALVLLGSSFSNNFATPAPVTAALQLVAEGFTSPMALVPLNDGRTLIADQVGVVRLLDRDGKLQVAPILNLSNKLSAINLGSFDERGLLCLALHPNFQENRRVFAIYTAPRRETAPTNYDCTLRLSEFILPAAEPLQIDARSERIVLEVDKPYFNHNGGRMAFGPDGFLYLSVGDGGGPKGCDIGEGHVPEGNGQNTKTLLAKILRIDVNGRDAARGTAYRIPADNPFADGRDGLPEIYAYGVRNPWGLTFDRGGDHSLFIGDVGQMRWEEVDIVKRGGNYGWPLREGFDGFNREHPELAPTSRPETGLRGEPLIDPIAVYKNVAGWKNDPEAMGNSVTGGYVYRGKALPELVGSYVFGDWSGIQGQPQGRLFVARPAAAAGTDRWAVDLIRVGRPYGCVCAFGEDSAGELYVLTSGSTGLVAGGGKVWKLVPAPAPKS